MPIACAKSGMAEIRCPLEVAAERHPGRPAILSVSRMLSYRELRCRVATTSAALRQAGIRAGIVAPNHPDYIVRLLAVKGLGAVCCPMNTRWPRRRVVEMLRRIDCRHVMVEATDEKGFEAFNRIREDTFAPAAAAPDVEIQDMAVPLERPATILFTSGSSGAPKAVLHSYGNHYYSALGANLNLPLGAGDRWLLNLPLYHVAGLGIVFRCLLAGASVVVPDRGETLGVALRRYRITHVSAVVTQLYRLMEQPEHSPCGSLRFVVLGGSETPRTLVKRALARGLPVFTTYGCTEMASQVTTAGVGATPGQRSSSGKLLPHRRLRISEAGEILVAGPTLFLGYVEGRRVSRPLSAEGWFVTGDLGRLDEEGYLTVIGRRDNRFSSGGETIHPEEVERTLCEHAGVERALVLPVPDGEFGHRGVAFVRLRAPRPDASTLERWLRQTLPGYMIPIAFYHWPDSEHEGMKIDRARFRRLALEGPKESVGENRQERH